MKHQFSADRAIDKIEQDRLGRSGFAAHLAEAALNWKENDSLVLALHGEWGSGKTSVKNLFKRHYESKGEKNIVEFNPWQWHGRADLDTVLLVKMSNECRSTLKLRLRLIR